jgi:hypothetical protein
MIRTPLDLLISRLRSAEETWHDKIVDESTVPAGSTLLAALFPPAQKQ